MPKNLPFFLVHQTERVSDHLLNGLLGLAVHQPKRPLDGDHAPPPPYHLKARDAIDCLYTEEPVVCKDVRLMMGTAKSKRGKFQLQRLVTAALGGESSEIVAHDAAVFCRFGMRNAPNTIRLLLAPDTPAPPAAAAPPQQQPDSFLGKIQARFVQDPAVTARRLQEQEAEEREKTRRRYRDEVLRLLQSHRKLYIVTNFITCTDMTKSTYSEKRREIKLFAGLSKEMTGGTGLEANGGAESSSSATATAVGTYDGEYLIACSYLVLDFKDTTKGGLAKWLQGVKPKSEAEEIDFRVGKDEVWRLGLEPPEGTYAAPMGVGETVAAADDDGDHSLRAAALPLVLLHPDDNLGENTGDNEVEDSDDSDSDSESEEE